MAGNYMDAPASRLAYDRDGSVGTAFTASGLMTALSAAQLQALNSEAETGLTLATQQVLAIIFPAPVDIAAVFLAISGSNYPNWSLQTSKDSTTGLDGTWTDHPPIVGALRNTKPQYRQESQLNFTTPGTPSQAVRGVRINYGSNTSAPIRAFHIYGDLSTSVAVDRVAFWHPDLDEEVPPAYFDWGNTPRGSSADRSFRIKNLSPDLTANDVTIYAQALTAGVPSVAGMHSLSSNGGSTFLTNITVDELAPGEISSELILRRVVPMNAQVSVWSARLAADVTSWTS